MEHILCGWQKGYQTSGDMLCASCCTCCDMFWNISCVVGRRDTKHPVACYVPVAAHVMSLALGLYALLKHAMHILHINCHVMFQGAGAIKSLLRAVYWSGTAKFSFLLRDKQGLVTQNLLLKGAMAPQNCQIKTLGVTQNFPCASILQEKHPSSQGALAPAQHQEENVKDLPSSSYPTNNALISKKTTSS